MKLKIDANSQSEATRRQNQQKLALADLAHIGTVSTADSSAIASVSGETAFDASYTIERKTLEKGSAVQLYASGRYSTKPGSTPALTLSVKVAGALLCTSGAITLGDGVTDKPWTLRPTIVCRKTGLDGEVVCALEGMIGTTPVHVPAGAAVAVVTEDDVLVEIAANWGAADAANTITLAILTALHL